MHRSTVGQSCPPRAESLSSALDLEACTQVFVSSWRFSSAEVLVADTEMCQRLIELR